MPSLPREHVFSAQIAAGAPLHPHAIPIGPMRITARTTASLISEIMDRVSQPGTQHIVTANAQFYVLTHRDKEFRRCVEEAEHVCADGMSVVLACRLLGKEHVERITGVDLVPLLCAEGAKRGQSVYFLGGRPAMAARAASLLLERYPGLQIAGSSCPPQGFLSNPTCLQEELAAIKRVNPCIVFVALGAPLQEHFIRRHLKSLGVPIAVGVGGSFEIIAGAVPRAPLWMQNAGLEWSFRLLQEPRRLAMRYLAGNSHFLCYLLVYSLKRKRSRSKFAGVGALNGKGNEG